MAAGFNPNVVLHAPANPPVQPVQMGQDPAVVAEMEARRRRRRRRRYY